MSVLKDWLAGATNTVLWVEYEAYARRVFAHSPPDWYTDPVRFASTLIQARGVIPSQCLSVDVLAPFLATLDDPVAKQASDEIINLLGADAEIDFINTALDALFHRFGGQLDLFIKLRTPADLLSVGPDAATIAFDDLDDVATAYSNFLRPLADKPVAGVLLEKRGEVSLTPDEIDAYEPIISAARHYDWLTAMSFPDLKVDATLEVQLDLDVLLMPQRALEWITNEATDPRNGGGLTEAYWSGAAISANEAFGRLLYGCIPESSNPETVLSVLREFA